MRWKSHLTAADVMTKNPRTCSPFSTVLEAVMIFRDAGCGAVPVLDQGKPVGILTDRDIALAVSEFPEIASRSVGDLMTKDLITVSGTDNLDAVVRKLGDNKVRRLLVIDASEDLIGIIAWADLASAFSDEEIGEVVSEIVESA